MLHRIRKIVNVKPYTIVCEWTNGEIRAIILEEKIREWSIEPGSVYKNLLTASIFNKVKLDAESHTLYWNGLIKMTDDNGKSFNAPLDIDPEVLYQLSIPVNEKNNVDNIAA